MKTLRTSLALLILLTSIISSQTFAQGTTDYISLLNFNLRWTARTEREKEAKQERAREVVQDNEYTTTGYEAGIFLSNPLMLDGRPLDYGDFSLASSGELTVVKVAPASEQTIEVPFNAYLRRNGNKVLVPRNETPNPNQTRVDIRALLQHAEPGDQLVIEAVNKEDGSVKTILKLLSLGC